MARSATKHRVTRERSLHVIEYAKVRFRIPALDDGDDRLLYLGDDADGVASRSWRSNSSPASCS